MMIYERIYLIFKITQYSVRSPTLIYSFTLYVQSELVEKGL